MSKRKCTISPVHRKSGTFYQEVPNSIADPDYDGLVEVAYNGIDPRGYEKIYLFGDRSSGFKTTGSPQDFQKLRQHHVQNQTLFKDENFSPETIRLTRVIGKIAWKRPCEISPNPGFVIDRATRFDVDQGKLGDCWFLAAIANLTTNQTLFNFIVPMDQSFDENYAGIFHFRFWQYGRWVDVVIDDRLPTVDNKLVYLRSTDPNEFWTALLEKAYAKLYGSYKNIEGGQISEAMEDMCGGLSEFYRTSRPQIYEIIKMSYERSSFMGCSIVSSELEGERPDGLITSHAYSITKVQSIMMNNSEVKLLRLRNPWGNNAEWKGTWNDNSEYWNLVSQETRDNLLLRKNDGEFWMEVEDFQRLFTFLDICHLNPSSFFYYEGDNKKWNISMFDGTWIPNVTAGGGLEYKSTFANNHQYFMQVRGNNVDQTYAVVIGLMQKNRRVFGEHELPLEITIYKVPASSNQLLDDNFFKSNDPIVHKRENGIRQLTIRIMLPVGKYCIVPSTADTNMYGSYLLRVYSEMSANITEIDDDVHHSSDAVLNHSSSINEATVVDNTLPNVFKKVAGRQKEIGWDKVQKALNYKYGKRMFCFMQPKKLFSKESCKNIVALCDINYTGTLDYKEFSQLMTDVAALKMIFKKFDVDNSGRLNGFELRNLLSACGYKVNKQLLIIFMLRYGTKGSLNFENFVICVFKLKTMIDEFCKRRTTDLDDHINVNRNDWLKTTLYS